MAATSNGTEELGRRRGLKRIQSFEVEGLFGRDSGVRLPFPSHDEDFSSPQVRILSGRNGSGKTTCLRMISGALRLDFDPFRQVPFKEARLTLDSGEVLKVTRDTRNAKLPLTVDFEGSTARLTRAKNSPQYTAEQDLAREKLRAVALPLLSQVSFDLLTIDRAFSHQNADQTETFVTDKNGIVRSRRVEPARHQLASRVRDFMVEAQVDHYRFFRTEEANTLIQLLSKVNIGEATSKSDISAALELIVAASNRTERYGLSADVFEIAALRQALSPGEYDDDQSLAIISTYLEVQERLQRERDRLAYRLQQFENIMDEFLVDKTVRLTRLEGLVIRSEDVELNEGQLSSGEYHFLYMMVSALLCQRVGSVIAIDEPELSLHVRWQRKLISALARCASGAAPTFLFATHSIAIASEYADSVIHLSEID